MAAPNVCPLGYIQYKDHPLPTTPDFEVHSSLDVSLIRSTFSFTTHSRTLSFRWFLMELACIAIHHKYITLKLAGNIHHGAFCLYDMAVYVFLVTLLLLQVCTKFKQVHMCSLFTCAIIDKGEFAACYTPENE